MALKPIPKALIIIAVVIAAGYGINAALPMIKKETQQVKSVSTEEPVQIKNTAIVVQDTPTQAVPQSDVPATETEAEPSATVSNGGKGLEALLKAGKK